MTALLDEVLAAHGGLERWRTFDRVTVTGAVVGELWPRRGLEGLLADAHITLETKRQASTYRDYGEPGRTGHFTPERVWITDASGTVIDERASPAEHFGQQDMKAPWDLLDALFANGYGTWTEVMLPFMLTWPGTNVRELGPVDDARGHWRILTAEFPPDLLTHKNTRLWIGDDGRVARVEFTPSVGGVMPSAVFWSEYDTFDGIVMPRRRAMVPIKDNEPQAEPVMLDEHGLRFSFS